MGAGIELRRVLLGRGWRNPQVGGMLDKALSSRRVTAPSAALNWPGWDGEVHALRDGRGGP